MYGGVTDDVLVLPFAVSLLSNVQPGQKNPWLSYHISEVKTPVVSKPSAFFRGIALKRKTLNEKCQFKIYNF